VADFEPPPTHRLVEVQTEFSLRHLQLDLLQ